MGIPKITAVSGDVASLVTSNDYDAVVLVTSTIESLPFPFGDAITTASKADKSLSSEGVNIIVVPPTTTTTNSDDSSSSSSSSSTTTTSNASGNRVVLSVTAKLTTDSLVADVRLVADAAAAAFKRARSAGIVHPLFVLHLPSIASSSSDTYSKALEVSILSALATLYEPLQAREALVESEIEPIQSITFVASNIDDGNRAARIISAIEEGRRLARDLGSADPERMNPSNCASTIIESFKDSTVQVNVVSDINVIQSEYPLAAAVARASLHVERHHPRIVQLEYVGAEPITETLMFSGKGIVYDTGGADIKTNGIMAGMHLDKCGACNVAGFVKVASILKPKGVRIVAELGFVRNSCGSDAYVADEVIRSHGGARVLVLNTDAEGRFVLSDMLSHLRARAIRDSLPNVRLFTCATLTGHAARTVGPYTIAMDNGPARELGVASSLQTAGTIWGDPLEVSLLRREDFQWAKCKNKKADITQMGSAVPAGARGHQYGASFLILTSGLDTHGTDSEHPLAYTHLDIAGSAAEGGDYKFGKPTATPVLALTAQFVLSKEIEL